MKSGVVLLVAAALAGCNGAGESVPGPAALLPATAAPQLCREHGYLKATLYGAVDTGIDWSDRSFECQGMPRPNGEGARLRFAGQAGDDARPLAVIIALPALRYAATPTGIGSNVTLIEEGSGRFFSTPDLDSCWTDIEEQAALPDRRDTFAISGTLYCISPLGEVSGGATVSIPELHFSGTLDWNAS